MVKYRDCLFNKKGFTVVEIIASFALTVVISVFLFEILVEVKEVFEESSLKSNIIEKVGIISKNIKINVPKNCTKTSCDGLMSISSKTITVNGQVFDFLSGVSIVNSSVSNPTCLFDNCYVTVQFELSHAKLAENYKYKAVYYYSIS